MMIDLSLGTRLNDFGGYTVDTITRQRDEYGASKSAEPAVTEVTISDKAAP